jgi:hypothetical protein
VREPEPQQFSASLTGWKVAVTVRFSSSEPPLRTWTTVSSQLAEVLVGVSPVTSTASTEMPAPP